MKPRFIVFAATLAFAMSGCSQDAKKDASTDAEAAGPVDSAPGEDDQDEAAANAETGDSATAESEAQ
jgi:hypothetical protein